MCAFFHVFRSQKFSQNLKMLRDRGFIGGNCEQKMRLTVLPNNPRKSPHMQSAKSSDQIAFYTPQESLNLLIFHQTDQLPLRCDRADASLYHTNCKHALSAVAKCWLHITSLRKCFRAGRRNRIAVGQCNKQASILPRWFACPATNEVNYNAKNGKFKYSVYQRSPLGTDGKFAGFFNRSRFLLAISPLRIRSSRIW